MERIYTIETKSMYDKSYGDAMDLIEQLKLFCAEKNLASASKM